MPTGKTTRQTRPHRRGAGNNGGANGATSGGFVSIVLATVASRVVTLTFDRPVVVRRTPLWAIDGQVPSASRLTGPTTVELTYPQAVATDELMYVTYAPQTVCGLTGGAVAPRELVPLPAASQMTLAPAAEPSQAPPEKMAA